MIAWSPDTVRQLLVVQVESEPLFQAFAVWNIEIEGISAAGAGSGNLLGAAVAIPTQTPTDRQTS